MGREITDQNSNHPSLFPGQADSRQEGHILHSYKHQIDACACTSQCAKKTLHKPTIQHTPHKNVKMFGLSLTTK